jgi:NADPH:quinone reductase-like Zn-dependent oxidoreductase
MGLSLRSMMTSRFVRQRLLVLAEVPPGKDLATLRELVESGKVAPVIDRTYPLSQVPEAIRYLMVEHARAKVVITV